MWDLYEHLGIGNNGTISIIAAINGFITGYTFTYSILFSSKGPQFDMNEFDWKITVIPILVGIMFSILFQYFAVFVNNLLPLTFKPVFGFFLCISTIMFSITSFRNFIACMLISIHKKNQQ